MAPATEESDAFVEHEKVLELVRHPGRDGEELSCDTEGDQRVLLAKSHCKGERTSKVTPALDDPVGRAVEAVVVPRSEVDDGVEQLVALARHVSSRPGHQGRSDVHRNLGVMRDGPRGSVLLNLLLGLAERRISCLCVAIGTEEIIEGVGDAVDVGELGFVDGLLVRVVGVRSVDEGRLGRGRGVDFSGAGKKGAEGVGASLDLLDETAFDRSKIDDATVGGRDLRRQVSKWVD